MVTDADESLCTRTSVARCYSRGLCVQRTNRLAAREDRRTHPLAIRSGQHSSCGKSTFQGCLYSILRHKRSLLLETRISDLLSLSQNINMAIFYDQNKFRPTTGLTTAFRKPARTRLDPISVQQYPYKNRYLYLNAYTHVLTQLTCKRNTNSEQKHVHCYLTVNLMCLSKSDRHTSAGGREHLALACRDARGSRRWGGGVLGRR